MSAIPELSTDLDREDVQPYFLWDAPTSVADLRRRLHDPDPTARAIWIARVMREARYPDVWKFVSLDEILPLLPFIRRHLGRSRAFWDFLLDGWYRDGLLRQPPQ